METLDKSRKESNTVADGKQIKENGIGDGTFQSVDGEGNPMNIKLSQVYYVPTLTENLLSVSKITDQLLGVFR